MKNIFSNYKVIFCFWSRLQVLDQEIIKNWMNYLSFPKTMIKRSPCIWRTYVAQCCQDLLQQQLLYCWCHLMSSGQERQQMVGYWPHGLHHHHHLKVTEQCQTKTSHNKSQVLIRGRQETLPVIWYLRLVIHSLQASAKMCVFIVHLPFKACFRWILFECL